jgi:hypothetical protein
VEVTGGGILAWGIKAQPSIPSLQHTHVQPRTRNRITRIGIGIPSSHRSAQPIAPRSFFKIFIAPPSAESWRKQYATGNSLIFSAKALLGFKVQEVNRRTKKRKTDSLVSSAHAKDTVNIRQLFLIVWEWRDPTLLRVL